MGQLFGVMVLFLLGSRSAQGSFYAGQRLEYGIQEMNLLSSSFQVQIDVAEQKLLVGNEEI